MTDIMIVVIVIVVVLLLMFALYYNSIKRAFVKVQEGNSGIDVALGKRYSTLTNCQATVKGYMDYESSIFSKIIEARKNMSITEKAQVEDTYHQAQQQFFALAEQYPDLKASNNFLELQTAIVDCEEHLQAARRLYNANVANYNQKIITFPGVIIANMMKASKADFFECKADEKDNVKIQL